ncbi:unnamed protein product, partial [Chrysoparadoxa australica]
MTNKAWSFLHAKDPETPGRRRARFSLYNLEPGEYYFQDYAVTYFREGYARSEGEGQGRLKLCSRSLFLEPADTAAPCIKLPFRAMVSAISTKGQSTFCCECSRTIEIKRNGKVAPYVINKESDGTRRFAFNLLHTGLEEFLAELQPLRDLSLSSQAKGYGSEPSLLAPILEARLGPRAQEFDTNSLVDVREVLLLHKGRPLQADRVAPLLRSPGCVMLSSARIYFQPAQVNNVGNPVVSFP